MFTLWTERRKTKVQVLVYIGRSPEAFIKMIEAFGGEDELELEGQFAVMFNSEPIINEIKDYNVVLNKYPHSNRIMREQYWIGSSSYEDGKEIIDTWLDATFGMYDWNPLYLYIQDY